MGTTGAMLSLKGVEQDAVVDLFGLHPTSKEAVYNFPNWVMATKLPDGSCLFKTPTFQLVNDEAKLASLSRKGELYTLANSDNTTYAVASCWAAGEKKWEVRFDADMGPITQSGTIPDDYNAIVAALGEKHDLSDETGCIWMAVPQRLFAHYGGYLLDNRPSPFSTEDTMYFHF